MYTAEALIDMNERVHRSFSGLVEHCRTLTPEELDRTLEGFGAGSVREQLTHAIGAQRYWVGVIEGTVDPDDPEGIGDTIASLQEWRKAMEEHTAAYLRGADSAELNTPRPMDMWGGVTKDLMPARVVLRTLTHFFDHRGQVAAMCRAMGKPIPAGLDFPII